MEQNLTDFTSRIIKENTIITMFLSIGWVTTIFILGHYINHLKDKIEKLTSDNKDCAVTPTAKPASSKLPSLHDVMDIVRPDGVGEEIPMIVRKVYDTIKKLGNFTQS